LETGWFLELGILLVFGFFFVFLGIGIIFIILDIFANLIWILRQNAYGMIILLYDWNLC